MGTPVDYAARGGFPAASLLECEGMERSLPTVGRFGFRYWRRRDAVSFAAES
jgi:hypothetical protein